MNRINNGKIRDDRRYLRAGEKNHKLYDSNCKQKNFLPRKTLKFTENLRMGN